MPRNNFIQKSEIVIHIGPFNEVITNNAQTDNDTKYPTSFKVMIQWKKRNTYGVISRDSIIILLHKARRNALGMLKTINPRTFRLEIFKDVK